MNLVFLPIRDAFKFPILVYGSCKISSVRGEIIFKQGIKRGLLKIGISDPKRSLGAKSYISISGKFVVEGEVVLRRGIRLSINGEGELIAGDKLYVGDNCTIVTVDQIRIGQDVRVAHDCMIMDTDFHFVVNINSGHIKGNKKRVDIGDLSWLGAFSVVKKGAVLPKGTILAGPYSMISKDYSKELAEYSIIAGSPAKLLATGVRRVTNQKSEDMLSAYFSDKNNTLYEFDLSNGSLDEFCRRDD